MRTNEAQMGFVPVPLGFGVSQNAFVDPTLLRFGRRRRDRHVDRRLDRELLLRLRPVFGDEVLAATIEAGWWRNGRGVVGRQFLA